MKDPRQVMMEQTVAKVGEELVDELKDVTKGPPMGFLIVLFDVSVSDEGFAACVSNIRPEDRVKVLRQQADHLEAQLDAAEQAS